MKIIKEGKEIKTPVKQVTCKKCKAILEITASDLKEEFPDETDRLSRIRYYYKCPCCHNTNVLFSDDLSNEMHEEIYKIRDKRVNRLIKAINAVEKK